MPLSVLFCFWKFRVGQTSNIQIKNLGFTKLQHFMEKLQCISFRPKNNLISPTYLLQCDQSMIFMRDQNDYIYELTVYR